MKLFFKLIGAALVCVIVGVVYGFVSSFIDVFPFFAAIAAGLTYWAVTIVTKRQDKKAMVLGFLLGLLTFNMFLSTGLWGLQLEVRSEIEAIAKNDQYEVNTEELDELTVFYTNDYLKETTGHTGKLGFILLEAKRGFFSTSKLKQYEGAGLDYIGLILFAGKVLIMVLGPGLAAIHKDQTDTTDISLSPVDKPTGDVSL